MKIARPETANQPVSRINKETVNRSRSTGRKLMIAKGRDKTEVRLTLASP
ncbi:MAG: hypothetical protein LBP22_13095 [Deltaproteobacteria bacterium]|nr:hypothetical protein [Deltaproteobacteria bacterium]